MQWVAPWPRSPGEAVAQRVSARAAGLQQQSPVILHSMTPGHAIVADRHPDNSRQRPQGPASTRKLAKHIHWGPLWTCGVRAGLTSRGVATQRDAFARGLQVTTRFRNGSRNRQLETGERKNMQKAFYQDSKISKFVPKTQRSKGTLRFFSTLLRVFWSKN